MNIEDKRPVKTTTQFCDLDIGNAFAYDKAVYIKTESSGLSRNAFNLYSDEPVTFCASEVVVPVSVKVVIE